jgi:hypothetical protein
MFGFFSTNNKGTTTTTTTTDAVKHGTSVAAGVVGTAVVTKAGAGLAVPLIMKATAVAGPNGAIFLSGGPAAIAQSFSMLSVGGPICLAAVAAGVVAAGYQYYNKQ